MRTPWRQDRGCRQRERSLDSDAPGRSVRGAATGWLPPVQGGHVALPPLLHLRDPFSDAVVSGRQGGDPVQSTGFARKHIHVEFLVKELL